MLKSRDVNRDSICDRLEKKSPPKFPSQTFKEFTLRRKEIQGSVFEDYHESPSKFPSESYNFSHSRKISDENPKDLYWKAKFNSLEQKHSQRNSFNFLISVQKDYSESQDTIFYYKKLLKDKENQIEKLKGDLETRKTHQQIPVKDTNVKLSDLYNLNSRTHERTISNISMNHKRSPSFLTQDLGPSSHQRESSITQCIPYVNLKTCSTNTSKSRIMFKGILTHFLLLSTLLS